MIFFLLVFKPIEMYLKGFFFWQVSYFKMLPKTDFFRLANKFSARKKISNDLNRYFFQKDYPAYHEDLHIIL